jgi:hypothetical protein
MSIDEFGSSLLSQQRTRTRQNRERQEKDVKQERLFTLASVGVKLGNQFLAKRAEDFMNTEAVYAKKANYKSALNKASNVLEEYKKADAHAGGVEGYLTQKRADFLMQDAQQEYEGLDTLKPAEVRRYVNNQAAEWAKTNKVAFQSAYDAANRMGTMEDYDALLREEYQGPRSVGDWLGAKAKGFFAGKNPQVIKNSNVNTARSAYLDQSAASLNAFDAAVKANFDIDSAESIAKAVANNEVNKKDRELISTKPATVTVAAEGKSNTFQTIIKEYKEADGSTVQEKEWDTSDPRTKEYVEKYNLGVARVEKGESQTVTNEWGVTTTKTKITETNVLGVETSFYTETFDTDKGLVGTAAAVTEAEKSIISDALNTAAGVPTFTRGVSTDVTYQGLAQDYLNNSLPEGVERDAASIAAVNDRFLTLTAAKARMAIQRFTDDKDFTKAITTMGSEIAPLVLMAELRGIQSREGTDGLYRTEKGFEYNPEKGSVDLISALVSAEGTTAEITLSPDTLNSLINDTNLDEVVNLSTSHRASLLDAMTKTKSVQQFYTETAPLLFENGYGQENISNIAALVAVLDMSLQRDGYNRKVSEEDELTKELGRTAQIPFL